MRKLVILLALLFSLTVLGISIGKGQPNLVLTARGEEINFEEQVQETVGEEKAEESEYDLPYPGMLPDHPLYFLKMIRDRIQLFFTREPLSKYKLLLNNADKRIAAALALAEKGKTGLAASTATKAELYFQRAITEAEKLTADSEETREVFKRTLSASDKHAMVLMGIFSRLPEENKNSINEALKVNVAERERIMTRLGEEEQEEEKVQEEGIDEGEMEKKEAGEEAGKERSGEEGEDTRERE